jgi:20S proteasome alpha/beta subunit
MTTIVGIKTNSGLDSIVLASDLQSSDEEAETKFRIPRKIYVGDNWAMGDAGGDDKAVRRLYGKLRGNKNYGSNDNIAGEMLERAIKEKLFYEVRELNTELRKKDCSMDETHAFVFAVSKPELFLWKIDEFGNLKDPKEDHDIDYVCVGTGRERVEKYIEGLLDEEKFDRDEINTNAAIHIARGAMKAAEGDVWTGLGYDLVILTKAGVKVWGKKIREVLEKAETDKLEEIAKKYNS